MENKFILECCVDSVESAINASNGGADRLELCANLSIGGTSPSIFLFKEIRNISSIPMHVLLRPRFGDFLYTDYEKNIMKCEVELFRDAGAEGIVIGALKRNGELDFDFMKEIKNIAGDMNVVLHRAFDVCCDPFETLNQSIELGLHTILTSGQQNNCLNGMNLINELDERSKGKISIMAGSGMNSDVMKQFLLKTKIKAFHMSAKQVLDSEMEFRNKNVNMGIPSLSEYEVWRTSEEEIRKAKDILNNF